MEIYVLKFAGASSLLSVNVSGIAASGSVASAEASGSARVSAGTSRLTIAEMSTLMMSQGCVSSDAPPTELKEQSAEPPVLGASGLGPWGLRLRAYNRAYGIRAQGLGLIGLMGYRVQVRVYWARRSCRHRLIGTGIRLFLRMAQTNPRV